MLGYPATAKQAWENQRLLNNAPFTTKAVFEGAGVIIGFLVVIPALHLSRNPVIGCAKSLESGSLIMCLSKNKISLQNGEMLNAFGCNGK